MKKLLLGVAGSPVLHSKSPFLFTSMFSITNTSGEYIRLGLTTADEIKWIMEILDLKGINVTSPFKEEIIPYLDKIDKSAELVNAVNTIKKTNGSYHGFNTDVTGVIDSFKNQNCNLKNKKIIVLGAGGASRAAAYAAIHCNAADVVIINRTFKKGETASNRLNCRASHISSLQTELRDANIIISCLPSSVTPIKKEWLTSSHIILDANYKNSHLNKFAETIGCKIINGLDWLKYQAIPAFEKFSGQNFSIDSKKNLFNEIDFKKKQSAKNIFLIGFMGTGKSSIGKLLANHLSMNFADIDELIEKKEGKSISRIFEENGETYFRKLEQTVLYELSETDNTVVATGGGIVENSHNREFIKSTGTVIWLVTSIKGLLNRVDPSNRPLWKLNSLKKLWNKRKMFYAQVSDVVILNENKQINQVVARILQEDNLIPDFS